MTASLATTPLAQGIILFAHGSRDPLWHKPIEAVAAHIKDISPGTTVRCAFLELSPPNLPLAIQMLADEGIRAIRIVPMFIGVGKHAREDLPLLVDAAQELHPDILFSLNPAVGEDPRLIQMLAQIALNPPKQ